MRTLCFLCIATLFACQYSHVGSSDRINPGTEDSTHVIPEPKQLSLSNHWQSEHLQRHPLVGTIWDIRHAKAISSHELLGQLQDSQFILIGEKHDNPDHHRLQASLVSQIGGTGSESMAVAFEQIDETKGNALSNPELDSLEAHLEWKKSRWPDWKLYRPVFEAVIRSGAILKAAGRSINSAREIRDTSSHPLKKKYELDKPLPGDLQNSLEQELLASHCGMLPPVAVSGMVVIQRIWDATMAEAMLMNRRDTNILIAGNGHVRKDRGVPYYLRTRLSGEKVTSVGLLEVNPELQRLSSNSTQNLETDLPYDYVIFTPVFDAEDPCAKYFASSGKK